MKNSHSIRKLLFINNESIALIVFNTVNDAKNILYSSQRSLKGALLKTQINNLITDASNFLGFLIKDVEVVFEDTNFTKINYTDITFIDCYSEDDICKEIYKMAKIGNNFINEINFHSISYDELSKSAIVNCECIASDYKICSAFVLAINECNVEVTNLINIYTLINDKDISSQIIIDMSKETTVVSEYVLGKLVNLTNFDIQIQEIYAKLASKYSLTIEQVKKMLAIANNIEANDQTDILLNLNFDLKFRKFSGIKAGKFIKTYQDEIKARISKQFNLLNYSNVSVFTNKPINMIDSAKIINTNYIIGAETIDTDRVVAYNKINTINKDSQYEFETNSNFKIRSIAA